MALKGFVSSSRENLASRTYAQLREALMAGRFWPGQRLRIRELSDAMGVSDTPVREAIMQLVREGGLEMRSGQSITVTRLSLTRYRELREIRLLLEGLATEKAVPLLTGADLKQLKKLHDGLCGDAVVPIYGTPRTVAGDAISVDTNKCQLKPLNRSDDYGPTPFTDDQWSRMQALFPEGVCDFSKPGVNQQPTIPWQTYQDRNGSVIYGGTALPPPPAGSGIGWSAPAFRSSATGFASGQS